MTGLVDFNVDLSHAGAMMGAIQGTADAVKTKVYIVDLVESAQHELGARFNNFMNTVSLMQPQRYHHVYEWNHVGQPGYRLWKNTYTGTSATNRTSSFEFLPSHTEVPLPDPEFAPSSSGKQLSRRYIFWNKARIMEYNIPTHIFAKAAQALFINLRDSSFGDFSGMSTRTGKNSQRDSDRGFTFTNSATVVNQGGSQVAGSFTAAFISFHHDQAPRIFETEIKPRIEESTEKIVLSSGKVASTGRSGKTMGLKSYQIYFDASRELARSETLTSAERYRDSGYDERFRRAFE